jgi:hypothetical protein
MSLILYFFLSCKWSIYKQNRSLACHYFCTMQHFNIATLFHAVTEALVLIIFHFVFPHLYTSSSTQQRAPYHLLCKRRNKQLISLINRKAIQIHSHAMSPNEHSHETSTLNRSAFNTSDFTFRFHPSESALIHTMSRYGDCCLNGGSIFGLLIFFTLSVRRSLDINLVPSSPGWYLKCLSNYGFQGFVTEIQGDVICDWTARGFLLYGYRASILDLPISQTAID